MKGCTIEAERGSASLYSGLPFQLLLKGCTIEAFYWMSFPPYRWVSVVVERMYDWSRTRQRLSLLWIAVSVVVERMYDWSHTDVSVQLFFNRFQLLLKGCTIEANITVRSKHSDNVSVVVERMYDWSWPALHVPSGNTSFQLLLKGCTIEAPKPTDWKQMIFDSWFLICFSKMVDLHKKCHYFRKFGVIWVIAWLFLIVVVTSSYILSTTKSP